MHFILLLKTGRHAVDVRLLGFYRCLVGSYMVFNSSTAVRLGFWLWSEFSDVRLGPAAGDSPLRDAAFVSFPH